MYGVLAWGNAAGATIWPLLKKQKQAIRIIGNLRARDSTSAKFKELNLVKVNDMYVYATAIFMFHFRENKLPETKSITTTI